MMCAARSRRAGASTPSSDASSRPRPRRACDAGSGTTRGTNPPRTSTRWLPSASRASSSSATSAPTAAASSWAASSMCARAGPRARATLRAYFLCAAFGGAVFPGASGAGKEPAEPSPPIYAQAPVREAWIPMPDGVRLAADLSLPEAKKSGERFPVLLEYLPYRKVEDRGYSHALYSYFVRRGYAVARVDIRGTGSSEGTLVEYEYSDQEQRDGEAVIEWLSKQPFSTGAVGMFGISWGGFNSIHMAMRRPPALKAILAVEAADDLYEDDVHYIDGKMHVDSYDFEMDIHNAVPGAPEFRIDEDYFRERFDTTPWFLVYKKQQRDGAFWDRTSPNAHYDAIRIPSFLIGGWYDGYRDSVPRMLEHVRAPVKAMIGPW